KTLPHVEPLRVRILADESAKCIRRNNEGRLPNALIQAQIIGYSFGSSENPPVARVFIERREPIYGPKYRKCAARPLARTLVVSRLRLRGARIERLEVI